MKKLKIGITGTGAFGRCFISLFKAHPHVGSIALADVLPDRLREVAAEFNISETYPSHEELCKSSVDAIAIFTQRHLHAPQTVLALNSGKHVYSAVPAGVSLEEVEQIIETVKTTGLTYMTGETSYYYPTAIFCRGKHRNNEFGEFVYGEAEYLHDMSHGFYQAYQHSGGADWKRVAGIPPMLYPTHTASMLVSVIGQHMTHVSCLGYIDKSGDGVFGEGNNLWNNPFSNETALFRTSGGGMFRINEFRRVGFKGGSSVRTSLYGTQGCFEEQADSMYWTSLDREEVESLTDHLSCSKTKPVGPRLEGGEQEDFFSGVSAVHAVERLPPQFKSHSNGHLGSHQFLVDDFVRALQQDKLPPNNVWDSARYAIPGIVAHQSALKDGTLMVVPDFGDAPADKGHIDLTPYE